MIYCLEGKVIEKFNDRAVMLCGGVGFEVQMTKNGLSDLSPVGQEAKVLIHMIVREDSMELFGFCNPDERDCFKTLLGISGIGPKAAAAVMSELSPSDLSTAVATGDTALITRAQGVGPKAAQRIVLELKDKLGTLSSVSVKMQQPKQGNASKTIEAIDALMTLGYTQHEAKRAVGNMDLSDKSIEEIIKIALKDMM